jgi:hypothetical protein
MTKIFLERILKENIFSGRLILLISFLEEIFGGNKYKTQSNAKMIKSPI